MPSAAIMVPLVKQLVASWAESPQGPRGYIAGELPDGVVTVGGAPAMREVECRHRLTRTPIARVFSKADGTYRFDNLPLGEEYDVIGRDHARVYGDVIAYAIAPEPYA